MHAILVVNAGSSSVKFQIFALVVSGDPQRLIKGQLDGIGTRPRLRASTHDGSPLVDRQYTTREIADVPAAIAAAGSCCDKARRLNSSPSATASLMADRNTTGRLSSTKQHWRA